jgi:hypothetical protein
LTQSGVKEFVLPSRQRFVNHRLRRRIIGLKQSSGKCG